MEFLSELNAVLWGRVMVVLLLFSGIYLSFKTRFIQVKKFRHMLDNTVKKLFYKREKFLHNDSVTPFQAMSTALAGTIGTGSIAGIASAILLGGPGSVFWVWISGFLGMATKYSEILLSVKYHERNSEGKLIGGPMFYIEKAFKCRFPAVLFSAFAICASFAMGNTVQSNAISGILADAFGLSPWITGMLLSLLGAIVILGGVGTVSRVNERLVPFMAVFYILCSACVLLVNFAKIPSALCIIFKNAFSLRAVAGGAIQYGFSHGIFSNEAGLGSAPMAHGASDAKHPSEQGMWGMLEVFFATGVVCTLTSLVIITSGLWQNPQYDGAMLGVNAFENALGSVGKAGVLAATVLFALSSIFGWGYYGEVCTEYLSHKSKRTVMLYRTVYVLFVFVGAVSRMQVVWSIAEIINALMAVPNLLAVMLLGNKVKELTQEYFKK